MSRRTITYLVCGVLALLVLASGHGFLAQASNEPAPAKAVNIDSVKPLSASPFKMMETKVALEMGTIKGQDLGTYTLEQMNEKFGIMAGNVKVSAAWNPTSEHPAIAADASGFYIAFSYMNGTQHDLGFAKSTDSGVTWSVKKVDNPNKWATGKMDEVEPAICLNETGGIFVSYANASDRSNLGVIFSKDGGTTWTGGRFKLGAIGSYKFDLIARPSVAAATNVSQGDSFIVTVETKETTAGKAVTMLTLNNSKFSSGSWYLVWWNNPAGQDWTNPSTILYKDTSKNWLMQYFTFEAKNSSNQDTLMVGMYIDDLIGAPLFWQIDFGIITPINEVSPTIMKDGGNYIWLYAFDAFGDMDVRAGKSTDGNSFTIVNASAQKGVAETHPAATLSGTNSYVTFFEGKALKFVSSTDAGATWSAKAYKVTDPAGDAKDAEDNADVYISGGKGYACWADNRDSGAVYFSEMQPSGSISGKITDTSSVAIPSAKVDLKSGATLLGTVNSNATGGYLFDGIGQGSYTVEAGKAGYQNGTKPVTLGAGEDKTGQDIQLAPSTGDIKGTITDAADSKPIQGAQVQAKQGTNTKSATSGADGTYQITGLPVTGTGTDYTVTVTHTNYQSPSPATVNVKAGQASTKDFSLTFKTGQIIITVVDSKDSKAISGASVTLVPKSGQTAPAAQSTDANGKATFTSLKNGTWDVTVTASGFKDGSLPGVSLSPGQFLNQTVSLEATATTTGDNMMLYIILIIIIIVVIAVVVAVMMMRKKKQAQPMPGYGPQQQYGQQPYGQQPQYGPQQGGYPPQQPGYDQPPPTQIYPPQQPGYPPQGQQPPPGY